MFIYNLLKIKLHTYFHIIFPVKTCIDFYSLSTTHSHRHTQLQRRCWQRCLWRKQNRQRVILNLFSQTHITTITTTRATTRQTKRGSNKITKKKTDNKRFYFQAVKQKPATRRVGTAPTLQKQQQLSNIYTYIRYYVRYTSWRGTQICIMPKPVDVRAVEIS